MAYALLILGLFLWVAAHAFKRVAPERRAAMGDSGKGPVALILFASLVLMIIGYRWTDAADFAAAPDFFRHINNLLMLIAIYMLSPAPNRGKLLKGMRHPMLTGFSLWAISHLLVNWDPASILLFGVLLVWAIVTAQVINRAEPEWTPPPAGTYAKDAMFLAGSVVLLLIIGWIHGLLGYYPFPG